MLVEAAREELVPRVEAGQLGVVHEDVLFPEAEAAGFCARFEGLAAGQDPPLDVVVEALLLELPDVPAELGVFSLLLVGEGEGVVPVPLLPGGGRDAHVLLLGLAQGRHLGLVDRALVQAPAPLHDAACLLFPPAVAVLLLQVDGGGGGDLGVVAGYQLAKARECPVAQLYSVPV